jgi:hypothetical protein
MPGFKKGDKRAMLDSDMIGLPKSVLAENKKNLANASGGLVYTESNFKNKDIDVLKKKFKK